MMEIRGSPMLVTGKNILRRTNAADLAEVTGITCFADNDIGRTTLCATDGVDVARGG